MPKYTLIYFPVKGRAEPIRYMFHLSGVEFEDKTVTYEEFPKLKPSLPFGQVPVLEVDGKQIPQSHAILRYVADKVGLYGSNDWEKVQADVVLETIWETAAAGMQLFMEKDETKKDELRKTFEEETLAKNLEQLEKLLTQNKGGDGWFVGDKASVADVEAYTGYADFIPYLLKKKPDLSKYPKFEALIKRFGELPQIVEYIKKRPVTDL